MNDLRITYLQEYNGYILSGNLNARKCGYYTDIVEIILKQLDYMNYNYSDIFVFKIQINLPNEIYKKNNLFKSLIKKYCEYLERTGYKYQYFCIRKQFSSFNDSYVCYFILNFINHQFKFNANVFAKILSGILDLPFDVIKGFVMYCNDYLGYEVVKIIKKYDTLVFYECFEWLVKIAEVKNIFIVENFDFFDYSSIT